MTLYDSRWWLVFAALVLAACSEESLSKATPTSAVGASTTIGSVITTSSPTTLPTSTTSMPAFDLDQFLTSKLGGVFLESEDTVGVVVLVPPRAESDVDVML